MPEIRAETMTVNMGPQHPSTHGVLRLVLELDGETVLSASPTIGYLHTGIEKTIEQKKWQQVIPLVERMDYLSAQSNSMAFCLSVERLLGLEVPERVRWIRVLIAELQRINSHLVWLGTHGMEVGAVSVMLYCFRERELLLNINELLAGFRMFPSYMRVAEMREDLPGVPRHRSRVSGPASDEAASTRAVTKNPLIERTRGRRRIRETMRWPWPRVPMARAAGVRTTCAQSSVSRVHRLDSRFAPADGDSYAALPRGGSPRCGRAWGSAPCLARISPAVHSGRYDPRSRHPRRIACTPRWRRSFSTS